MATTKKDSVSINDNIPKNKVANLKSLFEKNTSANIKPEQKTPTISKGKIDSLRNIFNNINDDHINTSLNNITSKRSSAFKNSLNNINTTSANTPSKLDPNRINAFKNSLNNTKPISPANTPSKLDQNKINNLENLLDSKKNTPNKENKIADLKGQDKFRKWLESTPLVDIIKKIDHEIYNKNLYTNKKTTLDKISLYYNIEPEKLSSLELNKLNKLRELFPALKLDNIINPDEKCNSDIRDLIEKSSDPQIVIDEIKKYVISDNGYYIGDTSLLQDLTSFYNNPNQLNDTIIKNLYAIRKEFPEFKFNDKITNILDIEDLSMPSFDEFSKNNITKISTPSNSFNVKPTSLITVKTLPHKTFSIKSLFEKFTTKHFMNTKLIKFTNELVFKSLNSLKHKKIYQPTTIKEPTKKATKNKGKTKEKQSS